MVLVVCRLAAVHPRGGALVQGVRQGDQEGVRAGGAQVQGAARPSHKLLRLGCRRSGQLKKEVKNGGREVMKLGRVNG